MTSAPDDDRPAIDEDRVRHAIGRALDAVAVDADRPAFVPGPAPAASPRTGRRTDWVVVGAVAAAVLAVIAVGALARRGGDGDDTVASERSAADGCGPVGEGPVASGTLPNGEPWRVEVTGTPPDVAIFVSGVGGVMNLDDGTWPGPRPEEPPVWFDPVAGGFVVAAELPSHTATMAVDGEAGTVVACAYHAEAVDSASSARFAATYIAAEHDERLLVRALAADGELLATATALWMPDEPEPGSMRILHAVGEYWIPVDEFTDVDDSTTVSATTSTTPAGAAAGSRPPVPRTEGGQCGTEPPPFGFGFVPEGFDPAPIRYRDWRIANTPPGHEHGFELYDPTFVLLDGDGDAADGERRIDVFHGNSWRLANVVREELVVLGHPAWLSDNSSGAVAIDFQVTGNGDQCDYWAIMSRSVTEDELRAVAAALVLDG